MTAHPTATTAAEQTKAVARNFFERFDANDIDGAVALLADDACYWLAGKPELLPSAGPHDKQQMAELFRRMTVRMTDGLRMTVKSAIAEGDRAALEIESLGTLKNGRVYRNEYHVLVTVRATRITAVKEYYDTQHVHATWFQA